MAATLQELKDKFAEYIAANEDREAKQATHDQTVTALTEAVTTEQGAKDIWVAALTHENEVEDQLQALLEDYEPPQVPT